MDKKDNRRPSMLDSSNWTKRHWVIYWIIVALVIAWLAAGLIEVGKGK